MLIFTNDTLRAAYNYLNETSPFNKWNLPDGDDVDFKVARDRSVYGSHTFDGRKHAIAISSATVGHTATLMRTMAHEMVHVHERSNGPCGVIGHGTAFKRWAIEVCKHHGFDPRDF